MKSPQKNPLISVVIPTYNRENTIQRAINSVINQTYRNFEILVIDDGSSDNTKKKINKYLRKYPNFKYHRSNHKGVSSARNMGIKMASGEFISFLDSDDAFLPEKLERQLQYMNEKKINLSLSNGYIVIEESTKYLCSLEPSRIIQKEDIILNKVLSSASFIMINKKLSNKYLFDKNLKSSNDIDFLLRVMNDFKLGFINMPLVNINKENNNRRISRNVYVKIDSFKKLITKLNQSQYNLSQYETCLFLNKIYKKLSYFYLLDENYTQARLIIKKILADKNKSIRICLFYNILYFMTYYPYILKRIILFGQKLWQYGIKKE